MKAVIMAGGEGTRLRPLTCGRPKPMVPIVNKPVMEHIIELLKQYDANEIAVTLQYMPDMVKDYFGDGSEFGAKISYFVEQTPMGTAGSVRNAEEILDDTFIVISGDALTDIDLGKAMTFHKTKGSMATLILKRENNPLEYGVVVTDETGRITRFLEKPCWGEVFSDTVNTGIYILSPEIFNYYKRNEIFDFSKDLFPILLKEKKQMYGYITHDYWCDVGDLGAYINSHADILQGKVKIKIPGKQISDQIWVGENSIVDEGAILESPCIIGSNNHIKTKATIGAYTVIGDNNIINNRSVLKKSIIWNNCRLDNNVQLRGCVLCNKVQARDNVSLFESSVIGDGTELKENVIIKPSIKVWPDKTIDVGTEVNSNLVWGCKCTRSIFGHRGITGEINVDITPEFATKLGAAYGAIFKGKVKLGISCDNLAPSQMLKSAFISGLLSSGAFVYDFGQLLLPAARAAVRFYKTDGGIHISTSSSIDVKLSIDFLESNGNNIERSVERKITNIFIREDFMRCEGNNIKTSKLIPDFKPFYFRSIINGVNSKNLNYSVLVNSSSEYVLSLMRELLDELGCKNETILKQNDEGSNFVDRLKEGKFDIGVTINDTSEKMNLTDNSGRVVTEDMFMALISLIMLRITKGCTIVAPVSATGVLERLAEDNNGKVLRTKTSIQDIMSKIVSNSLNAEMFEQFALHFDAMAGLIKILDFMKTNDYSFNELVDMIPAFHIKHREVECPWNAKGKVIRSIMQENSSDTMETLEGVKIFKDDGWVLVLPDAERPVCKVISEGFTEEFAQELTDKFSKRIKDISESEN